MKSAWEEAPQSMQWYPAHEVDGLESFELFIRRLVSTLLLLITSTCRIKPSRKWSFFANIGKILWRGS